MQKYAMSEEDAFGLITSLENGVLCTNDEDGYPYATPVNHVFLDDRIYVHGRPRGTRVSNIARDPRCCMTFYDVDGYGDTGDSPCNTETVFRSVIVHGRIKPVDDPELKMRVLMAFAEKFTPGLSSIPIDDKRVSNTGVYEIAIERVTGKQHSRGKQPAGP